MKLYSFTNMYTSGIHAGIQTAHVISEMLRKYEQAHKINPECIVTRNKYLKMIDWADTHQTIVVLNAGGHTSLQNLYRELTQYSADWHLPLGKWYESEHALNGAMTAVGLVVDDKAWVVMRHLLSRYKLAT